MRLELRFFFQNPIQKWNARHRFPYKFLLQIIKIILVTAQVKIKKQTSTSSPFSKFYIVCFIIFSQLCIFAESRYNHMNYALNNKVTFSHLFVNIWDSGREVLNYPPVSGPLAVYQKTDFYESVNFAINRVRFWRKKIILLCLQVLISSFFFFSTETYQIPLVLILIYGKIIVLIHLNSVFVAMLEGKTLQISWMNSVVWNIHIE